MVEKYKYISSDVQGYLDQVKAELSSSNKAWYKVAVILKDAEKALAYDKKGMTTVAREAGLGKSTVSKLLTVAKSEQLESNLDKIGHIKAWTVLYELAILDDDKFDKVIGQVQQNQTLTVAKINRVLGKKKDEPSNLKTLVTVKIGEDVLDDQSFTLVEYSDIVTTLGDLKKRVPTLNVEISDIYQKSIEKFREECKDHDVCTRRTIFQDEYIRYLKERGEEIPMKKGKFSKRFDQNDCAFMEAWTIAHKNPVEGFAAIGAAHDEAKTQQKIAATVLGLRKGNRSLKAYRASKAAVPPPNS